MAVTPLPHCLPHPSTPSSSTLTLPTPSDFSHLCFRPPFFRTSPDLIISLHLLPSRDQRERAALSDDEGHSAPLPQGELRGLQICHQPLEQVS